MKPTLEEVAVALYGTYGWQSELARAHGVAIRTVQRWTVGTSPVPPGIWAELCRDMRSRRTLLADLVRRTSAAYVDVRSS